MKSCVAGRHLGTGLYTADLLYTLPTHAPHGGGKPLCYTVLRSGCSDFIVVVSVFSLTHVLGHMHYYVSLIITFHCEMASCSESPDPSSFPPPPCHSFPAVRRVWPRETRCNVPRLHLRLSSPGFTSSY